MSELPESTRRSVAGNVEQWTKVNEEYGDASAARSWMAEDISWGQFGVREEDIGSPLGNVSRLDILEAGCGTAYFSAWLARRGVAARTSSSLCFSHGIERTSGASRAGKRRGEGSPTSDQGRRKRRPVFPLDARRAEHGEKPVRAGGEQAGDSGVGVGRGVASRRAGA